MVATTLTYHSVVEATLGGISEVCPIGSGELCHVEDQFKILLKKSKSIASVRKDKTTAN